MAQSLFGDPSQTYPGQQTYGQVGPSSNPKKGGQSATPYDDFLQWQMDTYNTTQKAGQASAEGKPVTMQAPMPPPPPPPSFMPNGAPPVSADPPRLPGPPTLGAGLPTEVAGLQNTTIQALMKAIQNPAVSQMEISQMKGKSKEQAALLGKQNVASIRANLAARGFDPNASGYAQQKQSDIMNAIGGDLLGNYRDIELGAAGQNRNSLFQAINAGAGMVNDETQRQNLFDQLALQYQQLNQRRLESLFA